MTRRPRTFGCAALLLVFLGRPALGGDPVDSVDPFIGTGGEGHTYPGATVPFGMVQLSPDTDVRLFRESFPWAAGYRYQDNTILGFSHTHFSGTGHSDLGDVLLVPTTGPLQLEPGKADDPDSGYRSRFSHDEEGASPGYYWVMLKDPKIKAELTATTRVGLHRYTFPESDSGRILLDLVSSIYNYDTKVLWSQIRVESPTRVSGSRLTRGWAPGRQIFFVMEFSRPFDSYTLVNEQEEAYRGFGVIREKRLTRHPEMSGRKLKAAFDFKTKAGETILVKVAISSTGVDGARRNLEAEVPAWDFDGVRQAARAAWARELSKVRIEGSRKDERQFYTAVYHTMLAPVVYMDVDGRYRGLDGLVHEAKGFTNYHIFSLWDTYRALHPFFTLTQPQRDGEMIQSMVEHARQSATGTLPVWSFAGHETWCMIGYHAVSVIADAYLKGIRNFDVKAAYEAMKTTATRAAYGGLGDYMSLGYVAIDREPEAASKTLEYAYDDWTIARMAEALGETKDHETFARRAGSWKNIFDEKTLFARARKSDGTFREPFDPLYAQYGSDYTEGNAWQYTWYVPHDPRGLIQATGGPAKFVARLDELFSLKADPAKYAHVEDIAGLIGQYAHGNEPSQHIAYLYAYAGQPWRTQERIRQILDTLFDDTPQGISGNEDCGQMSAWYIFSVLGFYPVAPGSNEYVIGAPQVPRAVMELTGGRTFTVEAKNVSKANLYIQSATLNGKPHPRAFLTHDELMQGGTLAFVMGNRPNHRWGGPPAPAPYSVTVDTNLRR